MSESKKVFDVEPRKIWRLHAIFESHFIWV